MIRSSIYAIKHIHNCQSSRLKVKAPVASFALIDGVKLLKFNWNFAHKVCRMQKTWRADDAR